MKYRVYLVASLLLCTYGGVAEAADEANPKPEHKSKNARKVVYILNAVGLNGKEVMKFVDYVDDRVDDGYVRLADDEFMNGKISLQYELEAKISPEQVMIKYQPNNSDFEYTAQTEALMVNYKMKF